MARGRVEPQKVSRLSHIPELDGIRGVAALAVFFHHVCYTSIHTEGWGSGVLGLYSLSTFGYAGVDLFFVLSGFLITSLLIEDRASPKFYRNFYWKRALRILPLYLLCLAAVYLSYPASRSYVLMAVFFVANFAQVFHISTVGPFWTLAIEEQFYLLWPTVVRRRSVVQLVHWSVGIGLSAVILRLVAAAFGHHDYDLTFLRCDGLAIGAFIACQGRVRWGAFALGVLLFGIGQHYDGFAYGAAALQTGVTLLAGSLIAFTVTHTGAAYLAIFRSRILTFFGLISYAFYLIHLYVMSAYDHQHGPLAGGDTPAYAVRLVTVLGVSVAVSVFTRYAIERPALSLRRYVLATSSIPDSAESPSMPVSPRPESSALGSTRPSQ